MNLAIKRGTKKAVNLAIKQGTNKAVYPAIKLGTKKVVRNKKLTFYFGQNKSIMKIIKGEGLCF